jgi:4-hydroxy-tetrahydrodipicolinate reductase
MEHTKIALIGYGKMGHLIEQLALSRGCEVVLRIDSKTNRPSGVLRPDGLKGADAAVEFTNPEAAPENLKALAAAHIPTVSGTTGWYGKLPEVRQAFEKQGTGLVYSPNFSVGVAVFRRLVTQAAKMLKDEADYGAWAWEIHHDAKKDAPSGTLLHLAEAMKASGYARGIDLSSSRAGKHPGTHEVGFDSLADTITLRHVARSREGFALGALKAAKWIVSRSGVHTFEEVLFGSSQEP